VLQVFVLQVFVLQVFVLQVFVLQVFVLQVFVLQVLFVYRHNKAPCTSTHTHPSFDFNTKIQTPSLTPFPPSFSLSHPSFT
jgi:hypothetical protein